MKRIAMVLVLLQLMVIAPRPASAGVPRLAAKAVTSARSEWATLRMWWKCQDIQLRFTVTGPATDTLWWIRR